MLVTGANGFLGREIVRQLADSGVTVRAMVRKLPGPEQMHQNIEYFIGDVTDASSMHAAVSGIRVIVHAAGLVHQFGRKSSKGNAFQLVNTEGTKTVAEVAVAYSVQHLILISSVAVYGRRESFAAETAECHPVDAYGLSKLQAEEEGIRIAAAAELRLTILRMATIYGECDRGNIVRLMQVIDKRRFVWIGNGSNYKSLIYIGDAARACVFAATSHPVNHSQMNKTHEIYNVSGPPVTMAQIVRGIAFALGREAPSWRISGPLAISLTRILAACSLWRGPLARADRTLLKWLSSDVYISDRFRLEYRFDTQVSLEEGLCREAAWYRRAQKSGSECSIYQWRH